MGDLRIFRVVMVSGVLLLTLQLLDLATGGNAFLPKAVASDEPAAKEGAEHKGEGDVKAKEEGEHKVEGEAAKAETPDTAKDHAKADKASADDAPENLSRAEIELLQNLSARRNELDQRAQALDMREKLLEASEKRVGERIAELKSIEANIQSLLGTRDQAEEDKLASLVKVYESMKPKDAARIFEQLDMEVLLPVANRMKESKIGAVLAQMAPEAAQRLTVNMAHRMESPKDAAPAASGAAAAPAGKAG